MDDALLVLVFEPPPEELELVAIWSDSPSYPLPEVLELDELLNPLELVDGCLRRWSNCD